MSHEEFGAIDPTQRRVAEAVAAEREACAKVADDWLVTFRDRQPEHVSAQKWACDAVADIADEIRRRTQP